MIRILLGGLAALALAVPVTAGDAPPVSAFAGVPVAREAASAWAPDAFLVYVENDEALNEAGTAARWGYLFYSPIRNRARGYSVAEGRVEVADNLPFRFDAPPLPETWQDSRLAVTAAEDKVGRAYRLENGGRMSSAFLMRGGLHDKDPDRATWTVVYTAPDIPSLFVVVDASTGDVLGTWRG